MDSNNKTLAAMFWYFVNGRELNRTVVNKLLFFADAYSYVTTNEKLSLVNYIKKPFGPVPENINEVRSTLLEFGYISEKVYTNSNYIEYGYTVQSGDIEKVLQGFNSDKRSIIEKVKKNLANKNATTLSEISHRFEPWKSACWDSVLDFNKIDDSFTQWLIDNIGS